MEDDDGVLVEYFTCPLRFVGGPVSEFLTMRDYLEKYPHTAPAFSDVDPRYMAFDRYFSAKLADYQSRMQHTGGIR